MLTFKEFSDLVQPTEYYLEDEVAHFLGTFEGIVVEGAFYLGVLESLAIRDWEQDKYYCWGTIDEISFAFYSETTLADMIEKITAIKSGQPYSTKVTLELDLGNEEWYDLMKKAHEKDITLNQYVEEVLEHYITRLSE